MLAHVSQPGVPHLHCSVESLVRELSSTSSGGGPRTGFGVWVCGLRQAVHGPAVGCGYCSRELDSAGLDTLSNVGQLTCCQLYRYYWRLVFELNVVCIEHARRGLPTRGHRCGGGCGHPRPCGVGCCSAGGGQTATPSVSPQTPNEASGGHGRAHHDDGVCGIGRAWGLGGGYQ